MYVPPLFDMQFARLGKHRHLPPTPLDLQRRERLVDHEANDRLCAGQRRNHDVGIGSRDGYRTCLRKRLDERFFASLFEVLPQMREFPFTVRIGQSPAVVDLGVVIGEGERMAGKRRGAGRILDDDTALLFKFPERGEDLRRFVASQSGQKEHFVAGEFSGQHVFGRQQHSRPPHPRQVVKDHTRALRPVREVNRDIRQRLERREPRPQPLE